MAHLFRFFSHGGAARFVENVRAHNSKGASSIISSLAAGAVGGSVMSMNFPTQAAGCLASEPGKGASTAGEDSSDILDRGYRFERHHTCSSDAAGRTHSEVISRIVRGNGPDATVILLNRTQQDIATPSRVVWHFSSPDDLRNNSEWALALDEFLAAAEDLEADVLTRGGASRDVVQAMRDLLVHVRAASDSAAGAASSNAAPPGAAAAPPRDSDGASAAPPSPPGAPTCSPAVGAARAAAGPAGAVEPSVGAGPASGCAGPGTAARDATAAASAAPSAPSAASGETGPSCAVEQRSWREGAVAGQHACSLDDLWRGGPIMYRRGDASRAAARQLESGIKWPESWRAVAASLSAKVTSAYMSASNGASKGA